MLKKGGTGGRPDPFYWHWCGGL